MLSIHDWLNAKIKGDYYDLGDIKLPTPLCNSIVSLDTIEEQFMDNLGTEIFSSESGYTPIFHEGSYEVGRVNVSIKDVVIDVGANIGLFSTLCANRGCTVYSIEPNEDALDYLRRIKELNPTFDIRIINKAISDSNGVIPFYSCKNNIGRNTICDDIVDFWGKGDLFNVTQAESITLDTFVKLNRINKLDFIKADIEGSEINLLKGATETLKKFKPKLSICTYHRLEDRRY